MNLGNVGENKLALSFDECQDFVIIIFSSFYFYFSLAPRKMSAAYQRTKTFRLVFRLDLSIRI